MNLAMPLPPPPDVPVTELPRDTVRKLAHAYGFHRRLAGDRFAALLPIVFRERIYEDDGCVSGYEWAAKKASMTKAEVDRILDLWEDVGHYDCLWRLLAKGVGISKLERVAPHVTAENAAGMAHRVEKLTVSELQKWLAEQRSSGSSGLSKRHQKNKASSPARARETISFVSGLMGSSEVPGAAEPSGSPCVPADRASDVPDDCLAPACDQPDVAAADHDQAAMETPYVEKPAEAPETSVLSAARLGAVSLKTPVEVPEASERPAAPPSLCSHPEPDDFGDSLAMQPGPASQTCRLSLEVDAIDDKRIRELLDLYERLHGKRIGLGQLFGLLARWTLALGRLPSLEDVAAGQLEVSLEAASPEPERCPVGPTGVPEKPGESRPVGKPFVPRLIEVVVSIAETGWRFIRTAVGWTPVADGALTGFLRPPKAIPLANLRIAAIAAAQSASGGRHRPAAVDRYLVVRSGGYCEVGGCKNRAVAAHHRNRYTFDPSHHPDDIVCVCNAHHGLPHCGEIEDEGLDPQVWAVRQAGDTAGMPETDGTRVQAADFQFQARRIALASDIGI